MEDCANGYAAFILELVETARQTCRDPIVLIEQRLDFSRYVWDGFGTGDCVLIADGTLHVVDYKHGQGVLVEAEGNPQMMLYALGALELFDGIYDISTVSMTIYQPRRENISTYTVRSKESLYRWAEDVLRLASEQAYAGEGALRCGDWCRFCKAKSECRARAEENMALARYDFRKPPLLTDEEVETILSRVDDLIAWASDIKEYALQAALRGKHWDGWKLVEGRAKLPLHGRASSCAGCDRSWLRSLRKHPAWYHRDGKGARKNHFSRVAGSLGRETPRQTHSGAAKR